MFAQPSLPAASSRIGTTSPPATRGPTVSDYLTRWLIGRRSLRPSTRASYEIHIRRYLAPYLGMIILSELSTSDVDAMYSELLESRLSVATVRRIHATLMSALTQAERRGLIARNPAGFVDLPRASPTRVSTWTADQLSTFLHLVEGDRWHPLFLLMAATGMRRGEAIGLRWVDVDLEAGCIKVEQQIVAVGAHNHIGPPKTARGRRTIAIPAAVNHALTWHAAEQRLERWAASIDWIDTGLVFTDPTGRALVPGRVSRRFDQLVTVSRLPAIRLHDLRHTSASLGLTSGESLLEVSRRLGHSSITVTADVYSHLDADTARASADRLANLITGAAHTAGRTPPPR